VDLPALPVALWRVVIDIRGIAYGTRTERKEKGQCLACGYDLTGNVSGTCPECGEKVG
jgi:rubrerythrin